MKNKTHKKKDHEEVANNASTNKEQMKPKNSHVKGQSNKNKRKVK